MKYSSIRKLHYKTQRKKHLQMNIDLDDWFYSPYSCLKARFFIELSALIVSFLQYTPIRPNFITLLFAGSAIAGGFGGRDVNFPMYPVPRPRKLKKPGRTRGPAGRGSDGAGPGQGRGALDQAALARLRST